MRLIGQPSHYLSRRTLLAGGAAFVTACGRRRGTGFPGYAFVANESGRSVAAVDLSRFRVARRIALPAEPSQVVAHPTLPSVYVLTPRAGTVLEIDAENLRIKRHLRLGNAAVSMRLAPGGTALWVLAAEPRALVRVSLESFTPAVHIRLPEAPAEFDIASQSGHISVIFENSRRVLLADSHNARVSGTVELPAVPALARLRKDGRFLLAGHRDEAALTVMDLESGKSAVKLPLAFQPANFCSTPNDQLFISGPGMDAVAIVYPYRMEVAETILAGRSPGAMAATGDSALVFVANPESGEVSVVDVASHRLIAVVAVGAEPGFVSFTPDNQYALVLNRRSGDVAVIRVAAVIDRRTRMAPLFTMIPVGSKPVSAAVCRV